MTKLLKNKILLTTLSFLIYSNAQATVRCAYYSNILSTKSFMSWEHENAFKTKFAQLKEALRHKGYFETSKQKAQFELKNFSYACTELDDHGEPSCKQAKATIGMTYNTKPSKQKLYNHESTIRSNTTVNNSVNSAIRQSLIKLPNCDRRKGLERPLEN
ncbi:MAG: hypothetical protein ACXVCP_07630 [Bdellovibrio sp.]